MRKNASHHQTEGRRVRRQSLPAKLKAKAVTLPRRMPAPAAPPIQVIENLPVIASGQGFFRRLFSFGKKPTAMQTGEAVRAEDKKGRVLWIGDAVVPTGFGRVTHSILEHLCQEWDVIVSGVNYDGAAHSYPYKIMPAWQGGDMWGMDRFAHVCAEFAPDVVIINNDWWNVAGFIKEAPPGLPLVGYMPVDGANLNPAVIPQLNQLAAAIWYTDFGHQEAVKAGFRGERHVIPHGLDASQFKPVDRGVARRLLELPLAEDAFVVGNVNRNQPRKRLDLTLQYFAEWVHRHRVPEARLLLHCAKQDAGWDLESVARYYNIADRLVFTSVASMREGMDAARMPLVYSSMDVQVSTTLGEGWGLTTMEGMACGVPQIVPGWAALNEWPVPAEKVPCSTTMVHTEINTVGAVPDKEAFVERLQALYTDHARRRQQGQQSLRFVRQEAFQWSTVARQMDEVLTDAVLQAQAQAQGTAGCQAKEAAPAS